MRKSELQSVCVALIAALAVNFTPRSVHAQSEISDDVLWKELDTDGDKVYRNGNYSEAERLWLAALRVAERFGPEDGRLAISLGFLAELYQAQSRYSEAEPFQKRALSIEEKILGSEYPNVATSLNNLAELYRVQDRYAEAEPLHKRAIAIVEKAVGPEHPNVATFLENYAALLRRTNREAEAMKLEARVKAIRAKQAQSTPK